MRISGTFELVLRLLRTSSKLAENLFKILGDAHQRKIPLGKGKISLGQGKNFSWAREKILLGKGIFRLGQEKCPSIVLQPFGILF